MARAAAKSKQEWKRIIKRYVESGLTQAKFCSLEGISASGFSSQLSRWRKRGGLPAPVVSSLPKQVQAEFIPVDVILEHPAASAEPRPKSKPGSEPELIVELPMGVTLRFRGVAAQ